MEAGIEFIIIAESERARAQQRAFQKLHNGFIDAVANLSFFMSLAVPILG